MGQTEIKIFIILTGFSVLVFVIGTILFLFQYRKRRLIYEKEKIMINEKHKLDILHTKLESQQQTMQHIGSEIHDNVGQKLTLASLYSKQLSSNTVNLEDKIGSISRIIDESLTELRQLSKSLTNPEFANASLLALLNDEAVKINNSGICHVLIHSNETEPGLQQNQKNILFRLLQEFIQNSLKHSGCRKINITIQKQAEKLLIEARDDGKGFNTTELFEGIGLQNMKRRARQLNASFDLQSGEEKGTVLHLQLQLP